MNEKPELSGVSTMSGRQAKDGPPSLSPSRDRESGATKKLVDGGPEAADARASAERKAKPIGVLPLSHSLRFHASIVAFVYVLSLLALLLSFKIFGEVSFVLLLFLSGALGGVTTTYMRLRALPADEEGVMNSLTNKLAILQVYVSPAIAGVFGFILYGLFLADFLQGSLFPNFTGVDGEFTGVVSLFTDVGPLTQLDAVKSLLWAFLAGFSERMVPNILDKLATEAEGEQRDPNADSPATG